MDLLAMSCCSISAAAVGKAIKIWVARRQFGRVNDGQFAASMDTAGSGGLIWWFCCHCDACMGVVGDGLQGFWSGARGGGEKCPWWLCG